MDRSESEILGLGTGFSNQPSSTLLGDLFGQFFQNVTAVLATIDSEDHSRQRLPEICRQAIELFWSKLELELRSQKNFSLDDKSWPIHKQTLRNQGTDPNWVLAYLIVLATDDEWVNQALKWIEPDVRAVAKRLPLPNREQWVDESISRIWERLKLLSFRPSGRFAEWARIVPHNARVDEVRKENQGLRQSDLVEGSNVIEAGRQFVILEMTV